MYFCLRQRIVDASGIVFIYDDGTQKDLIHVHKWYISQYRLHCNHIINLNCNRIILAYSK